MMQKIYMFLIQCKQFVNWKFSLVNYLTVYAIMNQLILMQSYVNQPKADMQMHFFPLQKKMTNS